MFDMIRHSSTSTLFPRPFCGPLTPTIFSQFYDFGLTGGLPQIVNCFGSIPCVKHPVLVTQALKSPTVIINVLFLDPAINFILAN